MKYHAKTNRLIWYPYLVFFILMILCHTGVLGEMIVGNSLTELGVIANLVACGLLTTSASFLVYKFFQDRKNYEKIFITSLGEQECREKCRKFKRYSPTPRVKFYSESEENLVLKSDHDTVQPEKLALKFQQEGNETRVLCKLMSRKKVTDIVCCAFLIWLVLAIISAFLLTFEGVSVYDLTSSLGTALICGLILVPFCNFLHGGSTWAWKEFSPFLEKYIQTTEVSDSK